ncbi:hypothetical protein M0811_03997 [Anaeramoeba ignava]|uniref:Uncharacterized protein n=1 Tax=Anaeramoeba ignava TaxID=1746090 RepID=A0A9Q0LVK3_ANAIG|nr:hypothetical protein M0811_03997 [Anaeramoeba ignava]
MVDLDAFDNLYGETKQSENPFRQQSEFEEEKTPKILLMGLKKSGKTSIKHVVFYKMPPNKTIELESTPTLVQSDISNSSFIKFQIWEFPGQLDFFDSTFDSIGIFDNCQTIIYVIDSQEEVPESVSNLAKTIHHIHKNNYHKIGNKQDEKTIEMNFEVFIHKVERLTDEGKNDLQNDIEQRVLELLSENNLENEFEIRYYCTSIYDYSIFQAFSKVIQRLIPQYATLENLLDQLVKNSKIEKVFLFDVLSRIYVATDSSPVEDDVYELCSEFITMIFDFSNVYSVGKIQTNKPIKSQDSWISNTFDNDINNEIDLEIDLDQNIQKNQSNSNNTNKSNKSSQVINERNSAVVKLQTKNVLYFYEVNDYLSLVCLIPEKDFDFQGLIVYNFENFRQAISQIFKLDHINLFKRFGSKFDLVNREKLK